MNARKTLTIAAALVSALACSLAASAAGTGNHALSLKPAKPAKGVLMLAIKEDGQAAAHAKVSIVPAGSAKPEIVVTDAAGIIKVSLSAGAYLIAVADEPAAKPILVKISAAATTTAALDVEHEGGWCGNPPFGDGKTETPIIDAGSFPSSQG